MVLQFLSNRCTDWLSLPRLWDDAGNDTYFERKLWQCMEAASIFLCMAGLWCCVLYSKIYPSKRMQKYTEVFTDNSSWNGRVLCLSHGNCVPERSTYDILLWKCIVSCIEVTKLSWLTKEKGPEGPFSGFRD